MTASCKTMICIFKSRKKSRANPLFSDFLLVYSYKKYFLILTTRVFLHLLGLSTNWLFCSFLIIVPNPLNNRSFFPSSFPSLPSFLSFFLHRARLVKFQFSLHFRSDTLFHIPFLLH